MEGNNAPLVRALSETGELLGCTQECPKNYWAILLGARMLIRASSLAVGRYKS